MNTLTLFFEQLNAQRKQISLQGQIAIAIAVTACIAAIVGVGVWSSQPQYVPFLQNVNPKEMALVVAKLDAAKIRYQLSFSGSDILVDKSKWNKANLAAGDLAPGNLAEPDAQGSFADNPETIAARKLQNKEKRLAANLTRIEGIESANVHLSIADDSPFARERQPSSASVILNLRPGYKLSQQKSRGIISFIASAEKSLLPEYVQILDEKGNIYSHRGSENGGLPNDNYEMQKQLEFDKSFAAQTILEQMLGQGKAIVKVSAELNLEKNTLTTDTYDTDSQTKASETIDKMTTQEPELLPKGAPGTQGNFSKGFSHSNKPVIHEKETIDTTYVNGLRHSVTEFLPGQINRLTVAVTYDPWVRKKLASLKDTPVAAKADTLKSPSNENEFEELPIQDEQIKEIVKQAIGFDAERGDEITVIRAKLAESEFASLLESEPPGLISTYGNLARHASLGIAAILAFLFGTMTLRKLRPVTVVKESQTHITPERARQLSAISTLAQQHPEILGKVMAAWMNESAETAAPTQAAKPSQKMKRQAA